MIDEWDSVCDLRRMLGSDVERARNVGIPAATPGALTDSSLESLPFLRVTTLSRLPLGSTSTFRTLSSSVRHDEKQTPICDGNYCTYIPNPQVEFVFQVTIFG
jgi:hypothetical protein